MEQDEFAAAVLRPGGFIVALVTIFKQTWSPVTAPLYALLEGLVIGGVSALLEAQYPGIVIQAAGLTLGTCLALLLAYKSRLIRATENFKMGVVAATGVAWVDVREGEGGGTHIVLPVPLALAETAAAFVPEPIRDAAGHRLNRANRMAAAIGW